MLWTKWESMSFLFKWNIFIEWTMFKSLSIWLLFKLYFEYMSM